MLLIKLFQMCQSICDSIPHCTKPVLMCYTGSSYSDKCCELNYFAWTEPGISMDLAMLGLSGTLAFITLFVHEFKWLSNKIFALEYKTKDIPEEHRKKLDPDVWAEKDRVRHLTRKEIGKFGLVAVDLCKFHGENFAVKRLCMTVRQ